MYLFEFEFSPYICPGRSMRNPMINLFLVFQETSTLAAPAYISTGSVEGLLFLHALLSMLCIDFNIFIPLFLPVLGLVAARACCGRSELGRSVLAAHGLQQMGRAGSAVGARGCSCSVAGGICLSCGTQGIKPDEAATNVSSQFNFSLRTWRTKKEEKSPAEGVGAGP